MIGLSRPRTPRDLVPKIERLFELSAAKIRALEDRWTPADGAPVFTIDGRYAARGWTEWTQGFQFGAAVLQFDATGDREFLDTRPLAHDRAHGPAPDARRRARSRIQQRQHLRFTVAPGARRPHRRVRLGACTSTSSR